MHYAFSELIEICCANLRKQTLRIKHLGFDRQIRLVDLARAPGCSADHEHALHR